MRRKLFAASPLLLAALPAVASETIQNDHHLDLTIHPVGMAAVVIFVLAYTLAAVEDLTELRKSKPMVLAASIIWVLIGAVYVQNGLGEISGGAFRSALEGYAELFLFIMVSMTYLNAMEDRGVFESLKEWLLSKGFSYRQLFWITGVLSFLISSVCNNLTTALLMGTVVLSMGRDNRCFVTLSCINIVVAANAGGSFSPFGDITTLLVWQKGVVPFGGFYALLIPSIINFVLPAAVMSFWLPQEKPAPAHEHQAMKRGALRIVGLFGLTIVTAVCFENLLKLPPAAGMLAGLTYLKFFSYYMQKCPRDDGADFANEDELEMPYDLDESKHHRRSHDRRHDGAGAWTGVERRHDGDGHASAEPQFDVFQKVSRLEWDTLLFFYGVMVSMGGLSFIGYLESISHVLYGELDPSIANILVGILSAFIDNGTIMYAVLTMQPDISQGQWLLVTLTAGVGGSLSAIGSAAGVGLLGQAKGIYTFGSHLKWTPVILLGYIGSIAAHFLLNAGYF